MQLLGVQYELSAGFSFAETIDTWMRLGHAPVVGADEDWTILSGLAIRQDSMPDVCISEPDGQAWHTIDDDWWAHLPGIGHARNPIVVAHTRNRAQGWATQAAHLALQSARATTTPIQVFS